MGRLALVTTPCAGPYRSWCDGSPESVGFKRGVFPIPRIFDLQHYFMVRVIRTTTYIQAPAGGWWTLKRDYTTTVIIQRRFFGITFNQVVHKYTVKWRAATIPGYDWPKVHQIVTLRGTYTEYYRTFIKLF